jgi:hypothetical protein
LCGDYPCVWIIQREAVLANDENEHGHTYTIENKARHKVRYRPMFRVIMVAQVKKELEKVSQNASKQAFGHFSRMINAWDSWKSETLLISVRE